MKKSILIKGILALILISLLALGFTGCNGGGIICTTATVNITIPNDDFTYYIYIDGVYWGITNWLGNITLYNVPIGYHEFYAEATDCTWWWCCYGYAYQTINCGVNNVPIYIYCY